MPVALGGAERIDYGAYTLAFFYPAESRDAREERGKDEIDAWTARFLLQVRERRAVIILRRSRSGEHIKNTQPLIDLQGEKV